MTNEVQMLCFARKIAFFGNLNVAPYTTPAQNSDGKFFIFFGTIPQEVVFYSQLP
jgi:hypothetical protein